MSIVNMNLEFTPKNRQHGRQFEYAAYSMDLNLEHDREMGIYHIKAYQLGENPLDELRCLCDDNGIEGDIQLVVYGECPTRNTIDIDEHYEYMADLDLEDEIEESHNYKKGELTWII